MMKPGDHNRLIKQAARSAFSPIGCVQKGQSRTWLDDHGWWVTVVEFQPHSGAMGSYLNVGACWLWYEKDYFSFDDGYRVEAFRESLNTQDFTLDAQFLAERAKQEVLSLRLKYPSISACADHLRPQPRTSQWAMFHTAIAAGLSGDSRLAEVCFSEILRGKCRTDPDRALHTRAAELSDIAQDTERLKAVITDTVIKTRTLLNLPAIDPERNLFGSQSAPLSDG